MQKINSFHDFGIVSRELIINFGKQLNVSFPIQYINLISKYNALTPEESYIDFEDLDGKLGTCSLSFYGYGYKKIEVYDDEDLFLFQNSIAPSDAIERCQPDEYTYKGVISIGTTAGGDYLCFDYRLKPETDNPPVVLMYHDRFIEYENNQSKMATVKLADDFESFIDKLYKHPDDY